MLCYGFTYTQSGSLSEWESGSPSLLTTLEVVAVALPVVEMTILPVVVVRVFPGVVVRVFPDVKVRVFPVVEVTVFPVVVVTVLLVVVAVALDEDAVEVGAGVGVDVD